MKSLRLTLASLRSSVFDQEFNFSRIRQSLEIARESGARLLVVPEMMATGHANTPELGKYAEPLPHGPICRRLQEWSREFDLALCCGLVELDNRVYYNAQVIFDRGTYLGAQRKVNLSGDENWHFRAGTRLERFEIDGFRFGITICFDNHFPELAVLHARQGVDAILAPHAIRDTGLWPREMVQRAFGENTDLSRDPEAAEYTRGRVNLLRDQFAMLHRGRSFDHNIYSLVCNSVGPAPVRCDDVDHYHLGTLFACAPDGKVLLEHDGSLLQETWGTVELREDAFRKNWGPNRARVWARVDELWRHVATEKL